jgi:hypothetical protein
LQRKTNEIFLFAEYLNLPMRKFATMFVATAALFLVALGVGTTTRPVHAAEPFLSAVNVEEAPANKIHVVGYVHIQDMKYKDVFKFVTNLENDPKWYPGVMSSKLISGDGKKGTTYEEILNMGAGEMKITATVLQYFPYSYFKITSTGFLSNTTNMFFAPGARNSAYYVIDSYVDEAPGVTVESMHGYMQLTFANLLTALGKQGEVKIVK